MTTQELQRDLTNAIHAAKVRVTPAGEIEVVRGNEDASLYGPVEIAWYPDRLEITALGAGRASIAEGHLTGEGQDFIIEIRPPSLDELMETVPGAD
ncbi:MAG TPA: hypothetical protein VMS63_07750 [Gaiellaceae bacterium]|jgi:hypothetical protein|nr:hypothetical protein [Gaiellaceae bacterium]